EFAFILVVEVLQAMEVVQIPRDARVLAVDLESVKRLVPARVSRALERGERAVAEACEEGARVVNAHGRDFAGKRVLALLDERLGHGGDALHAAVEPEGGVNAVREQIAGDAA